MSTALSVVGQISLPVADLTRAVSFYRDVLGLPLLFEAPPGLAFFDAGGVRLMLALPEGTAPAPGGSVIYFRVQDIGATYEALVGRGASFLGPPHVIARLPDHVLWMAFFHDSEGNVLALMCEVAATPL